MYLCLDYLPYRSIKSLLAGGPYTFTAKRYTFTYTRMRMELDHEKRDADLIERGNKVREEVVVYGYVNENEEDSRSAATTWKARRSNSYRKRSCRARPTAPTHTKGFSKRRSIDLLKRQPRGRNFSDILSWLRHETPLLI